MQILYKFQYSFVKDLQERISENNVVTFLNNTLIWDIYKYNVYIKRKLACLFLKKIIALS